MVGLAASVCLGQIDRILLIRKEDSLWWRSSKKMRGLYTGDFSVLYTDFRAPSWVIFWPFSTPPSPRGLLCYFGSKVRGWSACTFVRVVKGMYPSASSLCHPMGLVVVHDRFLKVEITTVEFMLLQCMLQWPVCIRVGNFMCLNPHLQMHICIFG